MKNKKIIISILVVILIIVLGLGIFYWLKEDTQKPVEEPPIQEPNNPDNNGETDGLNKIENESEANYKEHCVNNLCITIGSFAMFDDYGGFSLKIINKGDSTIAANFKNIIFSTAEGDVKLFFYHPELESGKSIETEITFENKAIIQATDYKLEEPSAVEIMEYSSNMVN